MATHANFQDGFSRFADGQQGPGRDSGSIWLIINLQCFCCPSHHRFWGQNVYSVIEKLKAWTWQMPEPGHINTNYLTSSFRATDKELCFPFKDVLIESWCEDNMGLEVSPHIVCQFLIIHYRFSKVMSFSSPFIVPFLYYTLQHSRALTSAPPRNHIWTWFIY